MTAIANGIARVKYLMIWYKFCPQKQLVNERTTWIDGPIPPCSAVVSVCGEFFLATLWAIINHCLNATAYLSIIADHMHPFMATIYSHDNASCHEKCHSKQIVMRRFFCNEDCSSVAFLVTQNRIQKNTVRLWRSSRAFENVKRSANNLIWIIWLP